MQATLDPSLSYELKLESCPNPDFSEVEAPKPPLLASGKLDYLIKQAKEYRQGLGGGNWKRADLYLDGRHVAKMSYNGRFWPAGRWSRDMRPLVIADSSSMSVEVWLV